MNSPDHAMKWEKAVTSDDTARQGDSLVASLLRRGDSQPTPNDLQIGSSEPTTEESSVDQPGWMKAAIQRILWRQRLRMNLPLGWDPDRFPDPPSADTVQEHK